MEKIEREKLILASNAFIIIMLLTILGVTGFICDKSRDIAVKSADIPVIRDDTAELIRGTMTGRIGQPVGQEYIINKESNKK